MSSESKINHVFWKKGLFLNLWSRLSVVSTGFIAGVLFCDLFDVHIQTAHAFPKLTMVIMIVLISNEIVIAVYLFLKQKAQKK